MTLQVCLRCCSCTTADSLRILHRGAFSGYAVRLQPECALFFWQRAERMLSACSSSELRGRFARVAASFHVMWVTRVTAG